MGDHPSNVEALRGWYY